MLKAKEIIIFLPGDGEKEVFKDVEFQSNPEAGLLAIFKNNGKESIMFSGQQVGEDLPLDTSKITPISEVIKEIL